MIISLSEVIGKESCYISDSRVVVGISIIFPRLVLAASPAPVFVAG